MKTKPLANGLSKRTNNLLAKAGITIEKRAIMRSLQSGKLRVYDWPPNYGKYTHREVCQWVGVDPATLTRNWPNPAQEIFPDIGLSYRAWRTLKRAGITLTKAAVRHALKTGLLFPYKRPGNYGVVTHTEVCQWAGVSPKARPKTKLE